MKKLYLLALLFFYLNKLNSQVVFCPPGAEWTYNFREFWTWPAVSNEKIKCVGDSILGLDTLKILHHSKSFSYCNFRNCSPTLIKVKGDTVFFSNNCTQDAWQILYNFAALQGQTWTNTLLVKPNNAQTITYSNKVLATGTVSINSMVLKSYSVETTGSNRVFNTTVTERIGCSRFLFNFYAYIFTDADEVTRNLCYKDNEFGTAQFTAFPCDYSNPVGVDENKVEVNEFLVFPNPASDFIELTPGIIQNTSKIEFADLSGRIVKQMVFDRTKLIDVRELEGGLYLVKVLSSEGDFLGQSKFIKLN